MGWIVTRPITRTATREVADADAYLAALERFGADTRAPTPDPPPRTGRARLRESPLSELFRATAEQ